MPTKEGGVWWTWCVVTSRETTAEQWKWYPMDVYKFIFIIRLKIITCKLLVFYCTFVLVRPTKRHTTYILDVKELGPSLLFTLHHMHYMCNLSASLAKQDKKSPCCKPNGTWFPQLQKVSQTFHLHCVVRICLHEGQFHHDTWACECVYALLWIGTPSTVSVGVLKI